MSQRWWLIGVAIVGVILAVLLVPRPDTGVDIPDADPANTRPLDFKANPVAAPPPAPSPSPVREYTEDEPFGLKSRPPEREAVPDDEKNLSPEQKAFIEARMAKDPTAARAMVGPIGGIRRQLHVDGSDEAKALIARIAPVQAELSDIGQQPGSEGDIQDVVGRMDSLMDEVKSSKWYSDPLVKSSVGRYESARDAWRAE